MRGIRQVASVPIPTLGTAELAMEATAAGAAAARVKRLDYFTPAAGKAAEILKGSREEIAQHLLELMRAKGGLN
jgi:electron transfer flavoprotein beta subunit